MLSASVPGASLCLDCSACAAPGLVTPCVCTYPTSPFGPTPLVKRHEPSPNRQANSPVRIGMVAVRRATFLLLGNGLLGSLLGIRFELEGLATATTGLSCSVVLALPVHLVKVHRIWEAFQPDRSQADELELLANRKIPHGSRHQRLSSSGVGTDAGSQVD